MKLFNIILRVGSIVTKNLFIVIPDFAKNNSKKVRSKTSFGKEKFSKLDSWIMIQQKR